MPISQGIDPLADTQRFDRLRLASTVRRDARGHNAVVAPVELADTVRLERPVLRRAWPTRVAAVAFVAAAALSIACVAGV